jgi:hypothetical protein
MQSHGGQHSETDEPVHSITGNGGHSKKKLQPQITQMHADNPGSTEARLARCETLRLGPSASICVICG